MTMIPTLHLHLLLFLFCLENGVKGFVDMSCNPTNAALGEPSTCTCRTDSASGIVWRKDGTDIMLCFTGGACDISLPAYSNGYTTSGTDKVFTITINDFAYSDCSVFTCKDQATTDTISETLELSYDFNVSVPLNTSEPGSGKKGNIEITTDCVYSGNVKNDFVVEWYSVDEDGNINEDITSKVEGRFMRSKSCSDTTKVCGGKNAVPLNIGIDIKEEAIEKYRMKVEVYREDDPSVKLKWTTTGSYCYTFCGFVIIVIVCIIFGILGIAGLCGLYYIIKNGLLDKVKILLLVLADIVLFLISLVLGAYAANDEAIECCLVWVIALAITFAVLSAIGLIVDIVVGVLVIVGVIKGKGADKGKTPAETQEMTKTSL